MSRTLKTSVYAGLLVLAAKSSIASDIIIDDFGDTVAAIPEPTGALVLGAGLATIAIVRRLRKRD